MSVLRRDDAITFVKGNMDAFIEAMSNDLLDHLMAALVEERTLRRKRAGFRVHDQTIPKSTVPRGTEDYFGSDGIEYQEQPKPADPSKFFDSVDPES